MVGGMGAIRRLRQRAVVNRFNGFTVVTLVGVKSEMFRVGFAEPHPVACLYLSEKTLLHGALLGK
jgi:hypothetical protein